MQNSVSEVKKPEGKTPIFDISDEEYQRNLRNEIKRLKNTISQAEKQGAERTTKCNTISCGWNLGGICKCPKTG